MKTTHNTSIKALACKAYMVIAAIVLGLNFTACSSADDEPTASVYGENAQVTEAQITYTYTVPEELFAYAEINVAYNNNEGTDAKWEPMLDNKFTVTYDINRFPMTAPVVFIYDKTNRSGSNVDVDWNLTMNVEVVMTIDGKKVVENHTETYKMEGNLDAAITTLQKNVLDRTYGVKISKNGTVKYVN